MSLQTAKALAAVRQQYGRLHEALMQRAVRRDAGDDSMEWAGVLDNISPLSNPLMLEKSGRSVNRSSASGSAAGGRSSLRHPEALVIQERERSANTSYVSEAAESATDAVEDEHAIRSPRRKGSDTEEGSDADSAGSLSEMTPAAAAVSSGTDGADNQDSTVLVPGLLSATQQEIREKVNRRQRRLEARAQQRKRERQGRIMELLHRGEFRDLFQGVAESFKPSTALEVYLRRLQGLAVEPTSGVDMPPAPSGIAAAIGDLPYLPDTTGVEVVDKSHRAHNAVVDEIKSAHPKKMRVVDRLRVAAYRSAELQVDVHSSENGRATHDFHRRHRADFGSNEKQIRNALGLKPRRARAHLGGAAQDAELGGLTRDDLSEEERRFMGFGTKVLAHTYKDLERRDRREARGGFATPSESSESASSADEDSDEDALGFDQAAQEEFLRDFLARRGADMVFAVANEHGLSAAALASQSPVHTPRAGKKKHATPARAIDPGDEEEDVCDVSEYLDEPGEDTFSKNRMQELRELVFGNGVEELLRRLVKSYGTIRDLRDAAGELQQTHFDYVAGEKQRLAELMAELTARHREDMHNAHADTKRLRAQLAEQSASHQALIRELERERQQLSDRLLQTGADSSNRIQDLEARLRNAEAEIAHLTERNQQLEAQQKHSDAVSERAVNALSHDLKMATNKIETLEHDVAFLGRSLNHVLCSAPAEHWAAPETQGGGAGSLKLLFAPPSQSNGGKTYLRRPLWEYKLVPLIDATADRQLQVDVVELTGEADPHETILDLRKQLRVARADIEGLRVSLSDKMALERELVELRELLRTRTKALEVLADWRKAAIRRRITKLGESCLLRAKLASTKRSLLSLGKDYRDLREQNAWLEEKLRIALGKRLRKRPNYNVAKDASESLGSTHATITGPETAEGDYDIADAATQKDLDPAFVAGAYAEMTRLEVAAETAFESSAGGGEYRSVPVTVIRPGHTARGITEAGTAKTLIVRLPLTKPRQWESIEGDNAVAGPTRMLGWNSRATMCTAAMIEAEMMGSADGQRRAAQMQDLRATGNTKKNIQLQKAIRALSPAVTPRGGAGHAHQRGGFPSRSPPATPRGTNLELSGTDRVMEYLQGYNDIPVDNSDGAGDADWSRHGESDGPLGARGSIAHDRMLQTTSSQASSEAPHYRNQHRRPTVAPGSNAKEDFGTQGATVFDGPAYAAPTAGGASAAPPPKMPALSADTVDVLLDAVAGDLRRPDVIAEARQKERDFQSGCNDRRYKPAPQRHPDGPSHHQGTVSMNALMAAQEQRFLHPADTSRGTSAASGPQRRPLSRASSGGATGGGAERPMTRLRADPTLRSRVEPAPTAVLLGDGVTGPLEVRGVPQSKYSLEALIGAAAPSAFTVVVQQADVLEERRAAAALEGLGEPAHDTSADRAFEIMLDVHPLQHHTPQQASALAMGDRSGAGGLSDSSRAQRREKTRPASCTDRLGTLRRFMLGGQRPPTPDEAHASQRHLKQLLHPKLPGGAWRSQTQPH